MTETCLVCHGAIDPPALARCTCGTPYHRDCRGKLGHCLATGCEGKARPALRFRQVGSDLLAHSTRGGAWSGEPGERAVECDAGVRERSWDLLALVSSPAPGGRSLKGQWLVRDAQGSLHLQIDDRRRRFDMAAGLSMVARSVRGSSRVEVRDGAWRTLPIWEQPVDEGSLGALARQVAAFLELRCEEIFERKTHNDAAPFVEPRVTTEPVDGTCQYCGVALAPEPVVLCPVCETPHHADCWAVGGGCTTYACSGRTALVPASAEAVSLHVPSGELAIEARRLRLPTSIAGQVPALPYPFVGFLESVPRQALVGLLVSALPFLFLPVGGGLLLAVMLAFPVVMVCVMLLLEFLPRPGPVWLETEGEALVLAWRGHRWLVAWAEGRKVQVSRKPELRLAQFKKKKDLAYELTLHFSGSRSITLAGPLLAPRQAGEARAAFLRELAEMRRFAVAASQAFGFTLDERYALPTLTEPGAGQGRR